MANDDDGPNVVRAGVIVRFPLCEIGHHISLLTEFEYNYSCRFIILVYIVLSM